MSDEQRGLLILLGGGALLAALALADTWLRRRRGLDETEWQAPATPGEAGWRPGWWLVGLALGCGLLRLPVAVGRSIRNVDEHWYAALAAFARESGESLFATPAVLRGVAFVHALAGAVGGGCGLVDALTSLAVGASGGLLGWAVWRAQGALVPALLTVPLYTLGLVPYEGLSSNAEPWVNLCLAGWVVVRLGRAEHDEAGPRAAESLGAGALLGLAALMKEQALPLLLVEPVWYGLVLARGPGTLAERAGRFGRDMTLAAAGYWIPLGLYLAGFASQGVLAAYVDNLIGWGGAMGQSDATLELERLGPLDVLVEVLAAVFPLLLHPLGLLGAALALRLALEASRLGQPGRRLGEGLGALALVTLGAITLGLEVHRHYFMLAMTSLAPLAALRLWGLPAELKRRDQRWPAAALLALALLLTLWQAATVVRQPRFASGASLEPGELEVVAAAAAELAERAPASEPVLVWGWRPELYVLSGRAPATRWRVNWLLRVPEQALLEDLRRYRPAAVAVPGTWGLLATPERDPFALERHPALAAWLEAEGYRPVARVGQRGADPGITLLVPGPPGQED